MQSVQVEVKSYPNSNVRTYITHKAPKRLCEQDGFIFRTRKSSKESFGVITFKEARDKRNRKVLRKLGRVGRDVIRAIGSDPLRKKFVAGTLVSYCQLNVEFVEGTEFDDIDRCVSGALRSALDAEINLQF